MRTLNGFEDGYYYDRRPVTPLMATLEMCIDRNQIFC